MIIALNGKIGSGKDLITSIIQYLSMYQGKPTLEFDKWLEWKDKYSKVEVESVCNWQNKKFADKLKDIVCLLLGCTREQLEDRDFKEKELGEEWDKYQLSWSDGYDTQYDIVPKDYDKSLYLDDRGEHWGNLHKRIPMTPRLLLQLLGTNCGRNIIHPNIWVNALMSEYKPNRPCRRDINQSCIERTNCGDWAFGEIEKPVEENCNKRFPNWIISDMRFPNEMKAIKDRGGITNTIDRDIRDKFKEEYESDLSNFKYEFEEWLEKYHIEEFNKRFHPSETSLDNATFDHYIDNIGSIEDLIEKVKTILIYEKIL